MRISRKWVTVERLRCTRGLPLALYRDLGAGGICICHLLQLERPRCVFYPNIKFGHGSIRVPPYRVHTILVCPACRCNLGMQGWLCLALCHHRGVRLFIKSTGLGSPLTARTTTRANCSTLGFVPLSWRSEWALGLSMLPRFSPVHVVLCVARLLLPACQEALYSVPYCSAWLFLPCPWVIPRALLCSLNHS